MELRFLQLAYVVRTHVDQFERCGGPEVIHDIELLQSAIAMPQASFDSEWLHRNLYEMAAAYGFHVCRNHAFIDANKRTVLACAVVFFEMNGVSIKDIEGRLYRTTIEVASGNLDKLGLAQVFRALE